MLDMKASKLGRWASLGSLCASLVHGQDYLVSPVPPALVQDADTTFLVDWATPKQVADFAAGDASLALDPNGFLPDGAYRGAVAFSSSVNFPTNAWTLELILRVPAAAASQDPIMLGRWRGNPQATEFDLHLEKGWGVRTKLYCWDGKDSLLAQPYAGGNGRSVQANATDKWVYLAFGCDFAGQQMMAAARDLNGDILNRDIQFAPSPWVDTGFLKSFPAEQQASELARRWLAVGQRFAASLPATLTLGHPQVDLRALRISKRFRAEAFAVEPALPKDGPDTWTPFGLDPARAQTRTVTRTVGYPGHNNFRSLTFQETYLPLAPGDPEVTIQLPNLPLGLYTLFVYGSVDPQGRTNLARVWQPCPMEFEAHDDAGTVLGRGRMLLKQSFIPRRMQGFHFHVDRPGNVTASFRLPTNSFETAWLQKIVLVDQLAQLPDVAVKSRQSAPALGASQLTTLSEARRARDDSIWATLPPLNTPLQVHAQVAQFMNPPSGVAADTWITGAFQGLPLYRQPAVTFAPWDFLNTNNSTVFPHKSILQGEPWPGAFPDDGTGFFFRQSQYPAQATDTYYTKRAELLGARYLLFAGAIMDSRGSFYGAKLPLEYSAKNNPETGHDAAMALVRWAYDWPALEMNLHEVRLCTHAPDFEYNTDWSDPARRNGKMYYTGWSGSETLWLFEAYDQVFPYIAGNQVFADAVQRFVPWVNTPQDVIRLLDRYLVFASVRDVKRGLIDGAAGVDDAAGQVLGPSPYTTNLFDLTQQYAAIYPASGTYQELYANALSRSGVYYIASFLTYAFGSAQELIGKATRMKEARAAGVALPMDLSDVERYPKVRSAGDFLLDMWVAGGFPFMVGDASGGPHNGLEAARRLGMASTAVAQAFALDGNPRLAWVLKHQFGRNDPAVTTAAEGQRDPVLHAASRVVPDYGAILELMPDETNALRKTSATLRLGIGQGHAHSDYLDLNFFAMGLPVAVDLACRNEGGFWSRPHAGWSFLHNHALAHDSDDPNGAGAQNGEPWLRAFTPPVLRASYVNQNGSVRLDRDVVLMRVGDSDVFYAFDAQRLQGGTNHTWAFHGCESDSLALNVPMEARAVRWTDRTLEGTQRIGASSNVIQATWTMTRTTNSFAYPFNGGGTLRTVAAEPSVLGPLYNPAQPPVRVRATLVGRPADTVLQGNPYSANYAYCFPFLWVQTTNELDSVYPAVYEWYRGETPVVASVELVQKEPLQVRVLTTSGQADTYEVTPDYCLAVSRNAEGIRWVKLSGAGRITLPDLALTPTPDYEVIVTDLDYGSRRLTTSGPLPAGSAVIAGNDNRRIFLQLQGSGTNFTWQEDLLVQEGVVTKAQVTASDTIALSSNQPVLFAGMGNRKAEAMTVTTEDGRWHFRNGRVIKAPAGVPLTSSVFSDANGDGLVNLKTYEIGVGDRLLVPAEVTMERAGKGWRIKTNVPLTGTLQGAILQLKASGDWQSIVSPEPPPGIRVRKRN